MADRPEDDLPFYDITAAVTQYRSYRVQANGLDDARVIFALDSGNLDYDIINEDFPTVIDMAEVER